MCLSKLSKCSIPRHFHRGAVVQAVAVTVKDWVVEACRELTLPSEELTALFEVLRHRPVLKRRLAIGLVFERFGHHQHHGVSAVVTTAPRRDLFDAGSKELAAEVVEDPVELGLAEVGDRRLPEERRRFAILNIPRHLFSEATAATARRATNPRSRARCIE